MLDQLKKVPNYSWLNRKTAALITDMVNFFLQNLLFLFGQLAEAYTQSAMVPRQNPLPMPSYVWNIP